MPPILPSGREAREERRDEGRRTTRVQLGLPARETGPVAPLARCLGSGVRHVLGGPNGGRAVRHPIRYDTVSFLNPPGAHSRHDERRTMSTAKISEVEHHAGRPLDASRDIALREAALELLTEIGYDRLTIEAVASRARASKTTIYRRWTGKAELVVDALNGLRSTAPVPDTGSLRGDLEAIARSAASTDNRF